MQKWLWAQPFCVWHLRLWWHEQGQHAWCTVVFISQPGCFCSPAVKSVWHTTGFISQPGCFCSSAVKSVSHYRFYLAARLFLLFSSKEWTNVDVSEGADIWIKKSVCCISIDTMTQASMGMEIFVHCLRCQASLHLKSLEVTWSCAVTAGFVRGQPNVNICSCAVTAALVGCWPNVSMALN